MQSEDLSDKLQERVLSIIKSSKAGITDDELELKIDVAPQERIAIINNLLKMGNIKISQGKDKQITYTYQDPEEAAKFRGLDREDIIIYNLISQAGNNGTWNGELKQKSGVPAQNLNRILKKLEKQNLIWSVKSVTHKNRKIWLKYGLEASEEISGGFFYKENELNLDLIESLRQRILHYIEKQGGASKKEIGIHLRSSKMTESDIKDENIQALIDNLIFDDKIEELPTSVKTNPTYRLTGWGDLIEEPVFTKTPCGTCPVFDECRSGSVISPQTCIYFENW